MPLQINRILVVSCDGKDVRFIAVGGATFMVGRWARKADIDPDIIYNSILSRVGVLRNDGGTLTDVTDLWLGAALFSQLIPDGRTPGLEVHDFDRDGDGSIVLGRTSFSASGLDHQSSQQRGFSGDLVPNNDLRQRVP